MSYQELTPPSPAKDRRLALTRQLQETLTPDQRTKMERVKTAAQQKHAALLKKVSAIAPKPGQTARDSRVIDTLVAGSVRILEEGERDSRPILDKRQRALMHEITAMGVQELRDYRREWVRRWKEARKQKPTH